MRTPPRRLAFVLGLGVLGAWPAVAGAGSAADLFYERSLIGAAGVRCKLFDSSVSAALTASGRQARGAALRAGADPDALDQLESRALDKAAHASCSSPDLAVVAKRVQAGFAGYARMNVMSFPGGLGTWRADRGATAGAGAAWRLAQTAKGRSGTAIFGVAATENGAETLTAVAGWPGALAASGARLVMRDPSKAPRAYLDPRHADLAAQLPPRAMTRAFLASARSLAAPGLLPPGSTTGAAFRFSAAAGAAMQRLDPREAVVLEVTYPTRDGERVEAIPVEVGDFSAGIAFLSAKR
ncbi:MAG TPA: hypothetical protein VL358_06270 [Caulobacteraceae bacterium]|jgi:hypothetical protein|nr:hypothetical protein [Caulobacteraceae bacterium]